jgi:hypothetical protein
MVVNLLIGLRFLSCGVVGIIIALLFLYLGSQKKGKLLSVKDTFSTILAIVATLSIVTSVLIFIWGGIVGTVLYYHAQKYRHDTSTVKFPMDTMGDNYYADRDGEEWFINLPIKIDRGYARPPVNIKVNMCAQPTDLLVEQQKFALAAVPRELLNAPMGWRQFLELDRSVSKISRYNQRILRERTLSFRKDTQDAIAQYVEQTDKTLGTRGTKHLSREMLVEDVSLNMKNKWQISKMRIDFVDTKAWKQ